MKENTPVLYAEDDTNDAFFVERAFGLAQISNPLLIVGTGQDAIDYMAGAGKYSNRLEFPAPCLVLLDLKMPLKSGLEVLAWIRAEHGAGIPVLVLTSSNQASDIYQAYAIGANGYLIKPGKPSELLLMVTGIKHFWLSVASCEA
jgi:CheY-like chemotaxis protein